MLTITENLTTVRYHYIPVRMAKIEDWAYQMFQGHGESRIYIHCMGM